MKSDSTVKEKFPLGRFFAWKTRDISLGCMVIILGYLSLYASTELGIPVGISTRSQIFLRGTLLITPTPVLVRQDRMNLR